MQGCKALCYGKEFFMKTCFIAGLLLVTSGAHAASLNVSQIQIQRTIDASYQCPGGEHFKVTYLNGDNGQNFAIVPYQGKPMLLVNAMSADGVTFQADSITWRIKGRSATLFDARKDANQPVLSGCKTN
jgi:membrane-bound inhibitor of C-type lysozyme